MIQIIKEEFELTIDMEEFLRKLGGSDDEINYYHFCVLLDAGTGGNPQQSQLIPIPEQRFLSLHALLVLRQ